MTAEFKGQPVHAITEEGRDPELLTLSSYKQVDSTNQGVQSVLSLNHYKLLMTYQRSNAFVFCSQLVAC
jgi:hypothetical protein